MANPMVSHNYAIPSIQTVYTLYKDIDRERVGVPTLHCKNVIKIPIAEPVGRKIGTDTYTATPYTAFVVDNDDNVMQSDLKIVVETNEGITVEPIVVHPPLVMYDTAYLLTLPRGTTGIKKAYIRAGDTYGSVVQNDLVFDIMEAPYNYENFLFALNYLEFVDFKRSAEGHIDELRQGMININEDVTNLKARVTALENKAGG